MPHQFLLLERVGNGYIVTPTPDRGDRVDFSSSSSFPNRAFVRKRYILSNLQYAAQISYPFGEEYGENYRILTESVEIKSDAGEEYPPIGQITNYRIFPNSVTGGYTLFANLNNMAAGDIIQMEILFMTLSLITPDPPTYYVNPTIDPPPSSSSAP